LTSRVTGLCLSSFELTILYSSISKLHQHHTQPCYHSRSLSITQRALLVLSQCLRPSPRFLHSAHATSPGSPTPSAADSKRITAVLLHLAADGKASLILQNSTSLLARSHMLPKQPLAAAALKCIQRCPSGAYPTLLNAQVSTYSRSSIKLLRSI
jgi:hypothetical protein